MKNATENRKNQGWTEVIIDSDCGFNKFYFVAELLRKELDVNYTKFGDFDSLYWDFNYRNSELTIHYNIYTGISLFPTAFEDAKEAENELVVQLGALLLKKLSEFGGLLDEIIQ